MAKKKVSGELVDTGGEVIDPKARKAYSVAFRTLENHVGSTLKTAQALRRIKDEKLFQTVGCRTWGEWVAQHSPYTADYCTRLIKTGETAAKLEGIKPGLVDRIGSMRRLIAVNGVKDEKSLKKVATNLEKALDKGEELTEEAFTKIVDAAKPKKNTGEVAKADAPLEESYVDCDSKEVPPELIPVWRTIDQHLTLARQLEEISDEILKISSVLGSHIHENFSITVREIAEDLKDQRPARVVDETTWLPQSDVEE